MENARQNGLMEREKKRLLTTRRKSVAKRKCVHRKIFERQDTLNAYSFRLNRLLEFLTINKHFLPHQKQFKLNHTAEHRIASNRFSYYAHIFIFIIIFIVNKL